MIENPCKKCDDPAMGCANTCGDLAEYRYIEKLEKELKQAKELLKEAINDINQLISDNGVCHIMKPCEECPCFNNGQVKCKWQYEAEALALIEGSST